MATLKAFGAMRFTPKAGDLRQLVCPPYDIISEEERTRYLDVNPHNIIRLELPREGAAPYAAAGETLRAWLEDGMLACDEPESLYLYEEEFNAPGGREKVCGLVARVRVEEFEKGVVLPHEQTLSKAKTDRFQLMRATGCNFSSIYSLFFDADRGVTTLIEGVCRENAEMEIRGEEDIAHRVWRITDKALIQKFIGLFGDKKLYIADGHHRYETALNYRNHLREQGVVTDESHPANYVMMTLVNMENPGLVVYPTHRIVRGLADFDPAKVLAGCREYFDVVQSSAEGIDRTLAEYDSRGQKAMALYTPGSCRVLALREPKVMEKMLPGASGALQMLDVSVLHTLVLEKLLGIDKENMANQRNLVYTRDMSQCIADVDGGRANCAFFLNPTKVEEIAAVAAAGEKMPQKSTYFYPKLITGHLMNKIL